MLNQEQELNLSCKLTSQELTKLALQIKQWGVELGFQQVGITNTDLSVAESHLQNWLAQGFHGSMDYLSDTALAMQQGLNDPTSAYISRYALGRDYHKMMRNRLQKLADKIHAECKVDADPLRMRAFVDSAPVLEKALAEKAGLGWIGKHSNLINRKAGSWFFLGELFTDLPLPVDEQTTAHCGGCTACLSICPTQAIVAPYQVDARRCVSYLTIELQGSIPVDLRALIGNRIYGCDAVSYTHLTLPTKRIV